MSMRVEHTQLVTGRKDLLVLLLWTLRRLPGRAEGAGGEEGRPAGSPPARLPAGGAGPEGARSGFLEAPVSGPGSLSAPAEAQPPGAGTSVGGGSSGETQEQEPAETG